MRFACIELSLSAVDLMSVFAIAVAAGPFFETANLRPGGTVILRPAGGMYSGSAVQAARRSPAAKAFEYSHHDGEE